jgi:hypothetical protein
MNHIFLICIIKDIIQAISKTHDIIDEDYKLLLKARYIANSVIICLLSYGLIYAVTFHYEHFRLMEYLARL